MFNTENLLPTLSIYVLHIIVTINTHYLCIKLQAIDHCNGSKHFLPSVTYERNLSIYLLYFREIHIQE